jgi:hypothetical protein
MATKATFVFAAIIAVSTSAPAVAQTETPGSGAARNSAPDAAPTVVFVPVDFPGEPTNPPGDPPGGDRNTKAIARTAGLNLVTPATAFGAALTPTTDESTIQSFEAEFQTARQVFFAKGEAAAIPPLQKIVDRADELLPALAGAPTSSQNFLKTHLLLWESQLRSGDTEVLEATMSAAATRFPSAQVDTRSHAPEVVKAFAEARNTLAAQGVPLTIILHSDDTPECRILLNGISSPDQTKVTVIVPPGSTYFVSAHCGDTSLPVLRRRVSPEGREVHLHPTVLRRITRGDAGYSLASPEAPEDTDAREYTACALGGTLGVDVVVLFSGDTGSLHSDGVHVAASGGACSPRVPSRAEAAVRSALQATGNGPTAFTLDGVEDAEATHTRPNETSGIQRPWMWTVGALTLAALSSSVAVDLAAADTRESVLDCISSTCDATRDGVLRDQLARELLTRDVLYISGAALAVGTVVLFFVEAPESPEESTGLHPPTTIHPWIGTHGAGANVATVW